MSHVATHWLADVAPTDMTHGEFRVLFHLCDCHNPSNGCFPKQTYLRDHTGLSNGGLNKALGELERKGLVRRVQTKDERTHRQKPTQYILGFELPDEADPAPLSGDGAVSTSEPVPSPLSGGSVSTGVESYTKEEPVKEPVKEPCAGSAHTSDFDDFLKRFLTAYPRIGSEEDTRHRLQGALDAGVGPDEILHAARMYALEQEGNARQYIAYSENWLKDERWKKHPRPAAAVSPTQRLAWIADRIKTGQPNLCLHITPSTARELIARRMVTEAECEAARVII